MNNLNIQWFPGHMAKTRRQIKERLPLVDAVAEIIDARIPVSSRNPELTGIIMDKKRIVLLNKSDLADSAATSGWVNRFGEEGIPALPVDARSGRGMDRFIPFVKEALKEQIAAYRKKGMVGRPIRIMVAGIPNVGKSSFINRLLGKSKAKVEDRAGVTRSHQWFRVEKGLELLDTPGVLWPKFDDAVVGENLAITGAIKDTVLDVEELALVLLGRLQGLCPKLLEARYKVDVPAEITAGELFLEIGRRRGMVIKGGEIDTERAAVMLLDEFRGGKIGRITLEI